MKKSVVVLFLFFFAMCGYLVYNKVHQDKVDGLTDALKLAEEAGTKISDLTNLDNHPEEDDEIPIVDTSAIETKRILPRNLFRYNIINKTANYTVQPADGSKLLTNRATSADIICTLPECVSSPSGAGQVGDGWNIIFYVLEDGYKITVDPHANDTIGDFASGTTEAGDYVYSDTSIGTAIKLVCMYGKDTGNEADAYNFYSLGYVGTWAAED